MYKDRERADYHAVRRSPHISGGRRCDLRLYVRGCLRGLAGGGGRWRKDAGGCERQGLRISHVGRVVTDVVLPCLDGRALLSAMRREWRRIPVLVVSGLDKLGAADGPLDGWLSKPFNARQLLAAVERLLEQGARSS